jgi:hypothetical protein
MTDYPTDKVTGVSIFIRIKMTKNEQLTEYIKEVLSLANDDLEFSVYDEDNNTDDLSKGIVNVWVEKLK